VRADDRHQDNALLVPQRAVQECKARIRWRSSATATRSASGASRRASASDNDWVIDGGLKPGERVVVDGLQRVREGVVVNAKPAEAGDTQLSFRGHA
jgi:membrane fusion protein (multidrug efflux system)